MSFDARIQEETSKTTLTTLMATSPPFRFRRWTGSQSGDDGHEIEQKCRTGRQYLLDGLPDLIRWAEDVEGCWEYTQRLRALLRAQEDGDEAVVAAYVEYGALPKPSQGATDPHPSMQRTSIYATDLDNFTDSRMSVVRWTLHTDQAKYEALLRLLFEDPVPVDADDLRQLRGATWRT